MNQKFAPVIVEHLFCKGKVKENLRQLYEVMKRGRCWIQTAFNQAERLYLKIVHAVRERDHKARVVVNGLVTENDINSVVKIPEIVLGCGQFTAVVLWVVPVWMRGKKKKATT